MMSGLVSYASSDEDEELDGPVSKKIVQSTSVAVNGTANITDPSVPEDRLKHASTGAPLSAPSSSLASPSTTVGPILGPTIPDKNVEFDLPEDNPPVPQSPYSANTALLRDLTLPTAPNYDIPQSPPGSPIGSTNAKFKQFLKLKKQGIHFNEKLANSPAMKNPDLMQRLLDFADVDESDQYLTTLSPALWHPTGFPEYAFKEQLSKSQQKIAKRKEEEKSLGQRESIDFISASVSESSSRGGTPGLVNRNSAKSAAERVMAGLDKGRSGSPQLHGIKRKSRFDT